MNIQIKKQDLALIGAIAVFVLTTIVACQVLYPSATSLVLQGVSLIIIISVLLELYRRTTIEIVEKHRESEYQRRNDYRQMEATFSLFFTIKPSLPLPSMRGWAASPDFLKRITEIVLSEKPTIVLEASSGVSTLMIAYALRRLGRGKVISLEHDPHYATVTQALVSFHGLDETATILYAPLKSVEIKGETWLWYDTEKLLLEEPVDLLVIDGPPAAVQKLSRYPALPVLYTKLRQNSTVVMDDGLRDDEQEIAAMWLAEFSDMESEFLQLEKGAFVFRKTG